MSEGKTKRDREPPMHRNRSEPCISELKNMRNEAPAMKRTSTYPSELNNPTSTTMENFTDQIYTSYLQPENKNGTSRLLDI